MIHVTKLNHEDLIINADLIELIESTPDTMLTLTTGKRLMVLQTAEQIVDLVLNYRERAGIRLAHPGMNPPVHPSPAEN